MVVSRPLVDAMWTRPSNVVTLVLSCRTIADLSVPKSPGVDWSGLVGTKTAGQSNSWTAVDCRERWCTRDGRAMRLFAMDGFWWRRRCARRVQSFFATQLKEGPLRAQVSHGPT